MKRLLFLLLSLSLGLNAGLLYVRYADQGQPRPMPGGPPPQQVHHQPPPPEVMIEEQMAVKTRHLNLSSEQQKAIREILEKHLPAMAELRNQARVSSSRMTEVYAESPFNKEEFQKLMVDAGQARFEADSLAALMLLEEASILNDEQRRLFAQRAPMAGQEGHRPPPGGGRLNR